MVEIRDKFSRYLNTVIEALAEKEGSKDNKKMIESFIGVYGNKTKTLSFRILDELLFKEQKTS